MREETAEKASLLTTEEHVSPVIRAQRAPVSKLGCTCPPVDNTYDICAIHYGQSVSPAIRAGLDQA